MRDESREIEAARYWQPWLDSIEFGRVSDCYGCPGCKRVGMPRRVSFNYAAEVDGAVPVFARNFCSRCVEDESTDDEWAMHWRVDRRKTQTEIEAARDAPWRGYAPLLQM